jgi:hypothetical protein
MILKVYDASVNRTNVRLHQSDNKTKAKINAVTESKRLLSFLMPIRIKVGSIK